MPVRLVSRISSSTRSRRAPVAWCQVGGRGFRRSGAAGGRGPHGRAPAIDHGCQVALSFLSRRATWALSTGSGCRLAQVAPHCPCRHTRTPHAHPGRVAPLTHHTINPYSPSPKTRTARFGQAILSVSLAVPRSVPFRCVCEMCAPSPAPFTLCSWQPRRCRRSIMTGRKRAQPCYRVKAHSCD